MADEQGLLGDENIRCSDCYPTLCVYAKSLSCVRLFVTAWTVARQAPLSTGIFQARILEWVTMPSSRRSSQPRDQTCIFYVSSIGRQILYHCATREAPV